MSASARLAARWCYRPSITQPLLVEHHTGPPTTINKDCILHGTATPDLKLLPFDTSAQSPAHSTDTLKVSRRPQSGRLLLSNCQRGGEGAAGHLEVGFHLKARPRGRAQRRNTAGGRNAVSGVWSRASCSLYPAPLFFPPVLALLRLVCVCVCVHLHVCTHAVYTMRTLLITPEALAPY